MDANITKDEAMEMIAAFLEQQLASGRNGERLISVNVFDRRITSVKASEEPPRLKRLPAIADNSLDETATARIQ